MKEISLPEAGRNRLLPAKKARFFAILSILCEVVREFYACKYQKPKGI